MSLLARRNLSHDRVRFTVIVTGIVFALVLIIVQFGLFSMDTKILETVVQLDPNQWQPLGPRGGWLSVGLTLAAYIMAPC